MAANEASRLRSEHSQPRAEEGSAARPLVRAPIGDEAQSAAPETDGSDAAFAALERAALERAAENIRPSWHGAELPPALERAAIEASLPAALPPPPALPAFSSFPIEQPAPRYRVDTTVRTAAILPERLAHLLTQPQIADASHWLRARPWARGGLAAAAVLLLAWLFWPSAPAAPAKTAAKPSTVNSAPALPVAPEPAPRAAPEPPASAAQGEDVAKQPEPAAPAVSVKKREKRKTAGKAATKLATVNTPTPKAAIGPAAKAAITPAAAKARKPAKATTAPAR